MRDRPSKPDPIFLRRLTTLPLVGGSVALVGTPTAVDLEPTPVMLEAYSAWLYHEHRYLNASFLLPNFDGDVSGAIPACNDGYRFHTRSAHVPETETEKEGWRDIGLMAQRRAALILSTVGCGWNGEQVLRHKQRR